MGQGSSLFMCNLARMSGFLARHIAIHALFIQGTKALPSYQEQNKTVNVGPLGADFFHCTPNYDFSSIKIIFINS